MAASQDVATFMAIMVLGLLITLATMGLLGSRIIVAESSKQEVLGLFGELTPDEIAETHASCERYMEYMDNFHSFSGKLRKTAAALNDSLGETQPEEDSDELEESNFEEDEVSMSFSDHSLPRYGRKAGKRLQSAEVIREETKEESSISHHHQSMSSLNQEIEPQEDLSKIEPNEDSSISAHGKDFDKGAAFLSRVIIREAPA